MVRGHIEQELFLLVMNSNLAKEPLTITFSPYFQYFKIITEVARPRWHGNFWNKAADFELTMDLLLSNNESIAYFNAEIDRRIALIESGDELAITQYAAQREVADAFFEKEREKRKDRLLMAAVEQQKKIHAEKMEKERKQKERDEFRRKLLENWRLIAGGAGVLLLLWWLF